MSEVQTFRESLKKCKLSSAKVLTTAEIAHASSQLPEERVIIHSFTSFARFRTIKHLPFLINLYHWIHETLGGTIDQSKNLNPLRQLIGGLESNEQKEHGLRLFESLKKVWQDVKENFGGYQVCHLAVAAGEGQIPDVNDDSPLMMFIQTGEEDLVEANHLYRVIKDIAHSQERMVPDAQELNVLMLPKETQPFSQLIMLDREEDPLGLMKSVATFEVDGAIFDWQSIEKRVTDLVSFLFFFYFP